MTAGEKEEKKEDCREAPKYIQTTFTSQIEGNREAPPRQRERQIDFEMAGEREEHVAREERGSAGRVQTEDWGRRPEEGATKRLQPPNDPPAPHAAFDNYSNYDEIHLNIGRITADASPPLERMPSTWIVRFYDRSN